MISHGRAVGDIAKQGTNLATQQQTGAARLSDLGIEPHLAQDAVASLSPPNTNV
jgi:hypothetical protein